VGVCEGGGLTRKRPAVDQWLQSVAVASLARAWRSIATDALMGEDAGIPRANPHGAHEVSWDIAHSGW